MTDEERLQYADELARAAHDARHQLVSQLRTSPAAGAASAPWSTLPEATKAGYRIVALAVAKRIASLGGAGVAAPAGVADATAPTKGASQRDALWAELELLAKRVDALEAAGSGGAAGSGAELDRRVSDLERFAKAALAGASLGARVEPAAAPAAAPTEPAPPNGEGGA